MGHIAVTRSHWDTDPSLANRWSNPLFNCLISGTAWGADRGIQLANTPLISSLIRPTLLNQLDLISICERTTQAKITSHISFDSDFPELYNDTGFTLQLMINDEKNVIFVDLSIGTDFHGGYIILYASSIDVKYLIRFTNYLKNNMYAVFCDSYSTR